MLWTIIIILLAVAIIVIASFIAVKAINKNKDSDKMTKG